MDQNSQNILMQVSKELKTGIKMLAGQVFF